MFIWLQKSSLVDGGWTKWLFNEDACSVSCGGGTRNQVRFCTNPTPSSGGLDCLGHSSQEVSCGTDVCPLTGEGGDISPVDGAWSRWFDEDPCSMSCGGGIKNQVRFCTNPAPSDGGLDCPGMANQEITCGADACPTAGETFQNISSLINSKFLR